MTLRRQFSLFLGCLLLATLPLAAQIKPPVEKPGPDARQRCWGNDRNAPILIEVYSDFMCPHCRALYLETMRQVLADYAMPGKVCVAYHEFPLPNNQYSRPAARYALAASRLGVQKWVQVMDALYYFQSEWAQDGQIEPVIAKALPEKDLAQVRTWSKDPRVETVIDNDLAEGRRRGVKSTPTLFITANGKTEKFVGAIQYDILQRYLEFQLAQRQP